MFRKIALVLIALFALAVGGLSLASHFSRAHQDHSGGGAQDAGSHDHCEH